jgi:hypothetical protein
MERNLNFKIEKTSCLKRAEADLFTEMPLHTSRAISK